MVILLCQGEQPRFAELARLKLEDLKKNAEDTKGALVVPTPQANGLEANRREDQRIPPEEAQPQEEARRRAEETETALAVPTMPVPQDNPAVEVSPMAPKPGDTFRDCPDCPEMVVIPNGSFTMGSPKTEQGRDDDEDLPHRVNFQRPFALGKYEVTRAEFAAFAQDEDHDGKGCWIYDPNRWFGNWYEDSSKSWSDPGFEQSERDPAVCVSWDDAQDYVEWLSRKTGEEYRLPSESEWEYAARAGTATARYWGKGPRDACLNGNVHDRTSKAENGFDWKYHECTDKYGQTAPVGEFSANDFGLHDVLGNAWEWVEDCRNKSYAGAPDDGSAWTNGNCAGRVRRGGSWYDNPAVLRTGNRAKDTTGLRDHFYGFRIAKTL